MRIVGTFVLVGWHSVISFNCDIQIIPQSTNLAYLEQRFCYAYTYIFFKKGCD